MNHVLDRLLQQHRVLEVLLFQGSAEVLVFEGKVEEGAVVLGGLVQPRAHRKRGGVISQKVF